MTRSEDLKKLASALRARAAQVEQDKIQKTASLVVAATGLELLRRKIKG